MSAIKEYEFLKSNGVLLELFPDLTGDWKSDSKIFTELWELNNDAIKDIDTYYDEV